MYNHIKAVIALHPRHQHALLLCLNQSSDPNTIAKLIGEKCRELRITDFRNPWSGWNDKLAKVWNDNFGLQSQEAENLSSTALRERQQAGDEAAAVKVVESEPETPDVVAESFDYKAATKEQIEQHVFDVAGVNLNTRMLKADLTKKAKAEIKKFEKANQSEAA